jgi:hypothetical protein
VREANEAHGERVADPGAAIVRDELEEPAAGVPRACLVQVKGVGVSREQVVTDQVVEALCARLANSPGAATLREIVAPAVLAAFLRGVESSPKLTELERAAFAAAFAQHAHSGTTTADGCLRVGARVVWQLRRALTLDTRGVTAEVAGVQVKQVVQEILAEQGR